MLNWAYEGKRMGFGGTNPPNVPMVIAVGIPNVPLFYPETAKQELGRITLDTLRLALQQIAGHVSDAFGASSDSGNLAQSFGANPATPTGGIEILGTDLLGGVSGRVFSSLPYAIVVEDGRRPGSPISKAGIDAIGLWAERKLGLSADEAKSAKFAIANHIVSQGLEGKHHAQTGFNAAKPGIEMIFADLAQTIGTALTTPGKAA